MVHLLEVGVCFFLGVVEVIEGLSTSPREPLKDCSVWVDVVSEMVARFVVVGLDRLKACVEDAHCVGDDVNCFARLEEACHVVSPFGSWGVVCVCD